MRYIGAIAKRSGPNGLASHAHHEAHLAFPFFFRFSRFHSL